MKVIKSLSAILLALLLFVLSACAAVEQIGGAIKDLASELEDLEEITENVSTDGGTYLSTQTETPAPATQPTAGPTAEPTTAKPTVSSQPTVEPITEPTTEPTDLPAIDENGTYNSKEDVALYIRTFGHLPSNFITKKQAEDLGWTGGSLEKYAPGKSIGGDYFGNYEKLLPTKRGRKYTECDIDTLGAKSRGAKRIVFSNDGLIYYTDDHYETFTLLYGEEKL